MKMIEPSADLLKTIESIERKKFYKSDRADIESKIIAVSSHGNPSYFIRADYLKSREGPKTPITHWVINNPYTPYFEEKRTHMQNLKELIKTEKKHKCPSHGSRTQLKKTKERTDFLLEPRVISEIELKDRISNDWLIFLKRQ